MKISTSLKKALSGVITGITCLFIILPTVQIRAQVQQADDPNLDQIPFYMRVNPQQRDLGVPLSTVITIGNYDNYNMGVDFAENNMAGNMQHPSWYFTAYNTNAGHHTEDGTNWANVVPNFGTSLAGDPVVAYDSLGNLFYINLYPGGTIAGIKVIKSTDNGATWGTAVTGCAGGDKCWIACDQTNGPYANNVYVCMTQVSLSAGNFARSTDHGATFTTTFSPSTQNLPGMSVCVGPNGNIQGGSVYTVTNSGNSFASTYTFYRSTDGGQNFTLQYTANWAGYVGSNVGNRNSVQNMRTRPYPYIAADNSYGPHRGRLYCCYASNDPPGNGNKPDIWVRYSDDFGVTWSSAIKVNDDPNTQNHHQWHPAIWCDKQTGRFYVNFMDTRDTPTSDSAYIYATYSDDGGVTFAPNQKVSNKKMKIDCPTCGGGGTPRYQGDYNGIYSNKKVSMSGWTDFRSGTFISMAGYFPDFAMALDHAADTIFTPLDSATFVVSIPEVKIYSDTVILSAVITPTPTGGSIVFHYPSGNTITTYPNSKPVNVVVNGNVTSGNYQLAFTAASPNGTPVHIRNATLKVLPGNLFLAEATATPDNICEGQTSQLNVNVIGGTAPFSYQWTPAASLNNPTIPNPIATPAVSTMYHVTVNDNAAHTTADSVMVTVSTGPPAPGAISGSQLACASDTLIYSVQTVTGATSYSWTVPSDATILDGQNTIAIRVKFGTTSGPISVIAGNECGSSTPSVLNVTVEVGPELIDEILGPDKLCNNTGATYYVGPASLSGYYHWIVPPGVTIISGQTTDTIHVLWNNQFGMISVYAQNDCGFSNQQNKNVAVDSVPLAAGMITGKDTVCKGHSGYLYNVQTAQGATSYIWSVPAGATINGVETGQQITVDFSDGAVSGNISVKGRNDCGDGVENSKPVTVNTCGGIPIHTADGNVTIYPNPTDRILNVSINSPEKEYTLIVTDANGRELLKETMQNIAAGYVKQINVSTFAKGMYFIKLVNSEHNYTEKFVVQ